MPALHTRIIASSGRDLARAAPNAAPAAGAAAPTAFYADQGRGAANLALADSYARAARADYHRTIVDPELEPVDPGVDDFPFSELEPEDPSIESQLRQPPDEEDEEEEDDDDDDEEMSARQNDDEEEPPPDDEEERDVDITIVDVDEENEVIDDSAEMPV